MVVVPDKLEDLIQRYGVVGLHGIDMGRGILLESLDLKNMAIRWWFQSGRIC
jgi:hypothetical protein